MGIVQVEGLFIETPFTNSRLKLRIVELALEVYIAKAVTEAPGLDYNEMKVKFNFECTYDFNVQVHIKLNFSKTKMPSPVTGRR